MVRSAPPSDWEAYVVVGAVTIAMLIGKYLIAKGDAPISEVIKEEIEEIQHISKEIEHKIEERIEEIKK